MDMTRRESLALGLALATTACAPAGVGTAGTRAVPGNSLHALAQRSGRRFGSEIAWGAPGADRGSFANPAYAAILERECALLVPENELKWAWTRPSARFRYDIFGSFPDLMANRQHILRRPATARGYACRCTRRRHRPQMVQDERRFGSTIS